LHQSIYIIRIPQKFLPPVFCSIFSYIRNSATHFNYSSLNISCALLRLWRIFCLWQRQPFYNWCCNLLRSKHRYYCAIFVLHFIERIYTQSIKKMSELYLQIYFLCAILLHGQKIIIRCFKTKPRIKKTRTRVSLPDLFAIRQKNKYMSLKYKWNIWSFNTHSFLSYTFDFPPISKALLHFKFRLKNLFLFLQNKYILRNFCTFQNNLYKNVWKELSDSFTSISLLLICRFQWFQSI